MNLNINSEIIDEYLEIGDLKAVVDHWIYRIIIPGEHRYKEPEEFCLETFKQLYENTKEKLINFTPLNHNLWLRIFGPTEIPSNITICLIVGAPKGNEAIVREDNNGNRYIIIDLAQICTYSQDINQLDFIIFDFITHEVAHALVCLKYPYSDKLSKVQLLKQLTFDEGIAHFLSYQEDVLKVDWHSEEMEKRKASAYSKLNYFLEHVDDFSLELMKQSNSGSFWDKFASISGMFAIIEYYEKGGRLSRLLTHGPDLLIEYILKKS